MGERMEGLRPMTDLEVESVSREISLWKRRFWMAWVGLHICIPYVVISVIGTLHGVPFFLNGGFMLAMVFLYPIVISSLTYSNNRRAYEAISRDLAAKDVEIYRGSPDGFVRTPLAGLILPLPTGRSEEPAYAQALSVAHKKHSPDFPRYVPHGLLHQPVAHTRTLSASELSELEWTGRKLRTAWVLPTVVLALFGGALVGFNASEGWTLETLLLSLWLAPSFYCGYRWVNAIRLSRAMKRDLADGVALSATHDLKGTLTLIEYLPHSGLIWTVEEEPSFYRQM